MIHQMMDHYRHLNLIEVFCLPNLILYACLTFFFDKINLIFIDFYNPFVRVYVFNEDEPEHMCAIEVT